MQESWVRRFGLAKRLKGVIGNMKATRASLSTVSISELFILHYSKMNYQNKHMGFKSVSGSEHIK